MMRQHYTNGTESLRALKRVSRVASLFRQKYPKSMANHSVPAEPWDVHKFGGSSVADADCFRRVAAILDSLPSRRLGVVLSACRGVTDALLRLVSLAEKQDDGYRAEIGALRARHATIAETLLPPQS